jgi:hypothetical protein
VRRPNAFAAGAAAPLDQPSAIAGTPVTPDQIEPAAILERFCAFRDEPQSTECGELSIMINSVRRTVVLAPLAMAAAVFTLPASAARAISATLYKNPNCDCCNRYARYLDRNGFNVKTIDTDLARVQREHGVPHDLEGCHTLLVGGYVVDGLVPVDIVRRLLRERPAITGITLPGMPLGAPGMDEPGMEKQGPFVVHAFGKGEPFIYARE